MQVNRYFVFFTHNIRQNAYHMGMGMGMAILFLKLSSNSILVFYEGKSTCDDHTYVLLLLIKHETK